MKINSLKILYATFAVLCVFSIALVSCSTEEVEAPPFLKITPDNVLNGINFAATKSERTINVSTNVEGWSVVVEPGATWLTYEKSDKSVIVKVTENKDNDSRKGSLTVKAGSLTETIKVEQLGIAPAILVGTDFYPVKADGAIIELEVVSNIEYDIIIPADVDWLVEFKKETRAGMVTNNFEFKVDWNINEYERKTNIVIKQKDGDLERKVQVIQQGQTEYESGNTEDIKDDLKIKIVGGKASSFQPGTDIDKSFDGDFSSIYHSEWANGAANYFPITLEYYFEKVDFIDYMIYHPRSGGGNGNFKETEIWIRTEGSNDYIKLMDYDFKGSGSATKIVFDDPLLKPTAIRFVILSGAGDGQGFASCSEMEFYQINTGNYDPLDIFTDASCSELKQGVTLDDIVSIDETLYKNIAFHLYNNSYPNEFRIQEYKAWPHPDKWAQENKTSTLSLLDNPTGISVAEGEDLVVFVGETHGRSISIKVMNLDAKHFNEGKGGDGYDQASYYPLSEGVNKLKMKNKGLAYLFYHTADYASAPKIKVHFATGKVNGYFDTQKHSASDWQRIIDGAVDEYFDMLGKYSHITFTTEMFRKYTKNGKELMDTYDELCFMEREFMGLYKYNRDPVNRNYFQAMYGSYMYATSYRTCYNINNDEGMKRLMADPKSLKAGPWGPAHEVGHTFQTRPGFRWLGMTEVTNNVHSLVVQTGWGNGSRIEVEDMGRFNNRYENAYYNSFVKDVPHPGEGDVFCKLVSLWQLELYFGKAKNQPDTYKELYEKVRTTPNLPNAGLQQLEFVKMMSDITKTDLTDFFKLWGYLSPFDKELDDYGTARFTVLQSDIDKTIAYVKGKGYPDITEKLEYICDSNWEVFRDRKAIEKGTASVNGSSIMMRNWNNVVAYEAYEGDKLVFVTNRSSFKLDSPFTANTKIFAVAYDGTKIEVEYR